jgi:hypothetical protein
MTHTEALTNLKSLQDGMKKLMKDSQATYTQVKSMKLALDKAFIDVKTLERLAKNKKEGKTYEV